jgi:hypothetical protein
LRAAVCTKFLTRIDDAPTKSVARGLKCDVGLTPSASQGLRAGKTLMVARFPDVMFVCFWHKAGIPMALSDVCYQGISGPVADIAKDPGLALP